MKFLFHSNIISSTFFILQVQSSFGMTVRKFSSGITVD